MLIFLRVTNILGSIPVELLAEIIEPIIKARKIEKKELYTVKIEKSSQHTSIFSMLATSPQPYIQAFRYAFFPGLKQGGETSEKIYFDWRLAKERKKNPIRWIFQRNNLSPYNNVSGTFLYTKDDSSYEKKSADFNVVGVVQPAELILEG